MSFEVDKLSENELKDLIKISKYWLNKKIAERRNLKRKQYEL